MLCPDVFLDSVKDLTPEFLKKNGICGIVFDLDETLTPHCENGPAEDVLSHIAWLKEAGIPMILVSNSPEVRVADFNREMRLPFFFNARKPCVKVLKRAVKTMPFSSGRIAMVGDQLFTDVLAGKRLGLFTVMVSPLQDRTTKFFRLKRFFERILLRKRRKNR